MDFNVGDFVLYGTDGVCRINEVTERKLGDDLCKYFILIPIYDEKSTIFVPLSNEKLLNKMRCVTTESELAAMAEDLKNSDIEWIDADSQRKEVFRQIIEESRTYDLLKLLKLIYVHKEERLAEGKKLHVADERIMKDAEKILYDEVAYSLSITHEEAGSYIEDMLGLGYKNA